MIKNYLKVALRNLKRQKMYALINILGLSIGLSSFLLIYLYLNDELTYDQFHEEYESIYRFSYVRQWDNGNIEAQATSGSTWGPRYKALIPEVKDYLRIVHSGYPGYVKRQNDINAFMEPKFYWADDNFFEFFDFPLKIGNPKAVFSKLDNVVLSESAVKKYFGNEDPIGKSIEFNHNAGKIVLIVSGVMYDPPGNSHLKPEFMGNILRISQLYDQAWQWKLMEQNGDSFTFTYIKLSNKEAISKIQKDWSNFIQDVLKNNPNDPAEEYKEAKFTPIANMHFEPEMKWELEAPSDPAYVPIFTIAAILVLIIACVNFMNLATARSAKRAREVGLRKTLGSTRQQLIIQFYAESFLMTLISLLISYLIVAITLGYFNELTGKNLSSSLIFDPQSILILTILGLVVSVLSGSYPALYLSSFKPMSAFRGLLTSGRSAENTRKGLVVFQFSVSIVLIICTLVVFSQLQLINNSKLGKDKDRMLSIRLGGYGLGNKWQTFRDEVLKDSRFEKVAVGNHLPRLTHFGMINNKFQFPERNNEELEWNKFEVDFNFSKTFDLEFIAGRDFDPKISTDSTGVIINEAALKNLQLKASDVIGMTITDQVWNSQLQQQVDLHGKIIGVVRDFPYKSVNTAIEPLTIWGTPHRIDRIMYVKMIKGDYQEKIKVLESKWQDINPGFPMENWFLDFEFGRLYENERRMIKIFILFSVITIFIAALGLFALASYVTEQRKKEIGVRKVLGASSNNLVGLLIAYFLKLIAAAFVISAPIAWWVMKDWLNGFVYHVDVSLLLIIGSGLFVAMITLLTVAYDTYQTAISNPIKALRIE